MSREIRQIPLDYEWPRDERGNLAQKHAETYAQHMADPDYDQDRADGYEADPEWFSPEWPADAVMGWAVFQTVGEGSPVTPTFATQDELVHFLVNNGCYADPYRMETPCDPPMSREGAERFVYADGWVPSILVTPDHGVESGLAYTDREAQS